MTEPTHGGKRPGAGRPKGSGTKNPTPERALLALVKSVEESIRNKDFATAKDHASKLSYILSFIPPPAE